MGMMITLFWLPFAVYFIIQSTYALFQNTVWRESKTERTTSPFLEPVVSRVTLCDKLSMDMNLVFVPRFLGSTYQWLILDIMCLRC